MNEADKIKPGDVVTLKSGGPAMTVTQVNDASSFECMWFDDAFLHKEYFKTVALKLQKDETYPKNTGT